MFCDINTNLMNKINNFSNVERKEIIGRLGRYFTLPELVCPHVYGKYSESQIWSFFTTEALETLLVLREEILCKRKLFPARFTMQCVRSMQGKDDA